MKIVMDKKLGQAESERRRLEQQLITARSSSFYGSMISLDSNSDDSGSSPSPNPGTSSVEIPQNGKCIISNYRVIHSWDGGGGKFSVWC